MSELALGSIDYAIEEVERIEHLCKRHSFDNCVYHLKKARESLAGGLIDWDTILHCVLLFNMLLDKNIDKS